MVLPIQITFRNFEAPEELYAYIREQASRLERYYKRITSCRVMMETADGRKRGKIYHVRIDLGLPEGELLVESAPSLRSGLQDVHGEAMTKKSELGREHRNPRRAILDAFREMRRRLQDFGRKQRGDVKLRQVPLASGKVAALFEDEGYGFLETAGGRRVYFHRESVRDGRFPLLRLGTEVKLCEEEGEKGPQATTVKIAHPRKQSKIAAGVVPVPVRPGQG